MQVCTVQLYYHNPLKISFCCLNLVMELVRMYTMHALQSHMCNVIAFTDDNGHLRYSVCLGYKFANSKGVQHGGG